MIKIVPALFAKQLKQSAVYIILRELKYWVFLWTQHFHNACNGGNIQWVSENSEIGRRLSDTIYNLRHNYL